MENLLISLKLHHPAEPKKKIPLCRHRHRSRRSHSTQVDLKLTGKCNAHTVCTASLWFLLNHSVFHSPGVCLCVWVCVATMNNTQTINAWITTIKECRMSVQCESAKLSECEQKDKDAHPECARARAQRVCQLQAPMLLLFTMRCDVLCASYNICFKKKKKRNQSEGQQSILGCKTPFEERYKCRYFPIAWHTKAPKIFPTLVNTHTHTATQKIFPTMQRIDLFIFRRFNMRDLTWNVKQCHKNEATKQQRQENRAEINVGSYKVWKWWWNCNGRRAKGISLV